MPDSQIIPQLSGFYKMDFAQGSYFYGRTAFWGAGQESYVQPPAENVDKFAKMQNVMPPSFGGLSTRWGYAAFGSAQTAAIRRLVPYYNDTTEIRAIFGVCPDTTAPFIFALKEDGTAALTATALPAAVSGDAANLYAAASRDYLYMLDGAAADQLKWNGANTAGNLTKWGIAAPLTAPSLGSPTAGGVTLTSGRNYFAVYKNATTGHISDLSPVSASTGPLTNQEQPLSNIPVSSDSQVTQTLILATADGGDQTTLYLLATLTAGTTTYTDNEPEQSLLLLPVYQDTDSLGFEHGVAGNSVPPTVSGIVIPHQGRLWILDGENLYFSKSLTDLTTSSGAIVGRFEESWPGTNQMVVSKEAEQGTALFSDGVTLYVGTSRAIRRVTGSDPTTFSEPEIVFNEAGVFNQDVLKRVFREGQPVGMMWLTPDGRVMLSDFNTYQDVGTPVQDVLNTINRAGFPYATFVSWGAFDFYILAIPTGSNTVPNTLLIYDLRHQCWISWSLYDTAINALAFDIPNTGAPLFLFSDNAGGLWQMSSAYTVDRSGSTNAAISATLISAWQHLGDPMLRKWLNSVEILGSSASFTASLDGASLKSDFTSPNNIVSNAAPIAGPFGENKYFVAANGTKDRLYRLTLNWSGSFTLAGWAFEAVPINRF